MGSELRCLINDNKSSIDYEKIVTYVYRWQFA